MGLDIYQALEDRHGNNDRKMNSYFLLVDYVSVSWYVTTQCFTNIFGRLELDWITEGGSDVSFLGPRIPS